MLLELGLAISCVGVVVDTVPRIDLFISSEQAHPSQQQLIF